MFRICSQIWQGRDYVTLFFDEWVREGDFWLAEQDGEVAGFGKASRLGPGEWWLEGLRVEPRFRGAGIGSALSDWVLARTLAHRPRSLRLATAGVNRESLRIIRRMGFELLFRARFYRGRLRRPSGAADVFVPGVRTARDFLEQSTELTASHGLLGHTWVFRRARPGTVRELVRAGAVFGHGRPGRLDGLLIVRPHRYWPNELDIGFVGGTGKALAEFRKVIAGISRERGSKMVCGMAASPKMARVFSRLGMSQYRPIHRVLVFEHR